MANTAQSDYGASVRDVAPLYGMILQHRDDLDVTSAVQDCEDEVRALFPILVSIARLAARSEAKARFKRAPNSELAP
jgi:hypothetical protein